MILGWDIGGVNVKVARVDEVVLDARSRPFELQRQPDALVRVLSDLASDVGAIPTSSSLSCAVTMTAELSQMFRTKRDGVSFVLDAVGAAFPEADVRVFTTDGRFLDVDAARREPMAVAAANWAAAARLAATRWPTALLVDIGTTTTDIIPMVGGSVVAAGATDPGRLASGELVYTGALRTPVEAIAREVPYRDGFAGVSAEAFALIGDAHLWRGCLAARDYTVGTPDGRPATREFAGERLARVICADRELLDEADVSRIADAVAAAQVDIVTAAIKRVISRHPAIEAAVVAGLGAFIASEAACAAGLRVVSLEGEIGVDAARYAPAAAVALLYAENPWRGPCQVRAGEPDKARPTIPTPRFSQNAVDLVIKAGGSLLAHVEALDRLLAAIAGVARTQNVVIIPGGGPFADAVREVDARLGLGDEEAHWMAVLAMDQYAHLLAARLPIGAVVRSRPEVDAALGDGRVPVLAPSQWLLSSDPLPHSWEVTSDSIAAWVAGQLEAQRLLLVKPPDARGPDLVDSHFKRALTSSVDCECLPVDAAIQLLNQIAGSVNPAVETT